MKMAEPPFDFEAFELIRKHSGMILQSTRGPQATAHLHGNPHALVDELMRLARIGAHAEFAADNIPNTPVGAVVDQARRAGGA